MSDLQQVSDLSQTTDLSKMNDIEEIKNGQGTDASGDLDDMESTDNLREHFRSLVADESATNVPSNNESQADDSPHDQIPNNWPPTPWFSPDESSDDESSTKKSRGRKSAQAHLNERPPLNNLIDLVPATGGRIHLSGVGALYTTPDPLRAAGITHIISVVDFDIDDADVPLEEYTHLIIREEDTPRTDLLKWFPRVMEFIDAAIEGREDKLKDLGAVVMSEDDDGKSHAERDGGMSVVDIENGESEDEATGHVPGDSETDKSDAGDVAVKINATEDQARKKDGKVFIHCRMGQSRSVTLTMAYLLWREKGNITTVTALRWVAMARWPLDPFWTYYDQLEVWRNMLRSKGGWDDAIYAEWQKYEKMRQERKHKWQQQENEFGVLVGVESKNEKD